MKNLNTNYEGILEVLIKKLSNTFLSYQHKVPQLKDLELINLTLTAEFIRINDEKHLFRNVPDLKKLE